MKLIHEGKVRLWIVAENDSEAKQIEHFMEEWDSWMGYSPNGFGKFGAVGYDVQAPRQTNKERKENEQ